MENELEKKEYFGQLLLLYGKLLTKNISHRMELFYLNDYSITEISEVEEVSRNAVFESLSHGERQLEKYEDSLGLYKKNQRLALIAEKLSKEEKQDEKEKLIQELKGEIGYGI
jgi:uncharacterized protein